MFFVEDESQAQRVCNVVHAAVVWTANDGGLGLMMVMRTGNECRVGGMGQRRHLRVGERVMVVMSS